MLKYSLSLVPILYLVGLLQADEIEKSVRERAAAITKELEGNPSPKEKISKEEEKE